MVTPNSGAYSLANGLEWKHGENWKNAKRKIWY